MATLLVAYDLYVPGQKYECLEKKLKSYSRWCHLQRSVWMIETNSSCVDVRNYLATCLDSNDKLFVVKLAGEAAWRGQSDQVSNWIKASV